MAEKSSIVEENKGAINLQERKLFTKNQRLRKRCEFLAVKNQSIAAFGSLILVEKRVTAPGTFTRLGITVLRRYGKSHERNRFKRIVREAFRLSYHEIPSGLELIVKPRTKAKAASMQEIQQELLHLAKTDGI